MIDARYPHRIVLLTTRFQYADAHVFFSRARLYFDRLELSGWQYGRTRRATIPIDAIRSIEWADDPEARPNAVVRMDDGAEVRLVLPHLDTWRRMLRGRVVYPPRHESLFLQTPLPFDLLPGDIRPGEAAPEEDLPLPPTA